MRKVIAAILSIIMILSSVIVSSFAYEQRKIPFSEPDDSYQLITSHLTVLLFSEYSHETFDNDYFKDFVPNDITIEGITLVNEDGDINNSPKYQAILIVEIKDGNAEKIISLARALWESPKVMCVQYDYDNYWQNDGGGAFEKVPFAEPDCEFNTDNIHLMMFSDYSHDEFSIEYFKDYIPSDIEIERIDFVNAENSNDAYFHAILFVYIKNSNAEKAIRLARTLWDSPAVKYVGFDTLVYDEEPISEEKIPFAEPDTEFSVDQIHLMMLSDFSNDEFSVEYFADYIPSDIEIESIELFDPGFTSIENYHAILFVHIKNSNAEKAVRLARAIWECPAVMFVGFDTLVFDENPATPILRGDINGDGYIGVKDLKSLKSIIAGAIDDTRAYNSSDVNNDGLVNSRDISALKKLIAGG